MIKRKLFKKLMSIKRELDAFFFFSNSAAESSSAADPGWKNTYNS